MYHDGGWFFGALDHRAFAVQSVAPPAHREYPLGVPALVATVMHGSRGNVQDRGAPLPRAARRLRLCRLARAQAAAAAAAASRRALARPLAADDPRARARRHRRSAARRVLRRRGAAPRALARGGDARRAARSSPCSAPPRSRASGTRSRTAPSLPSSRSSRRCACGDPTSRGVSPSRSSSMFLTIVPWRVYVSAHHLRNQDVGLGNGHISSNATTSAGSSAGSGTSSSAPATSESRRSRPPRPCSRSRGRGSGGCLSPRSSSARRSSRCSSSSTSTRPQRSATSSTPPACGSSTRSASSPLPCCPCCS